MNPKRVMSARETVDAGTWATVTVGAGIIAYALATLDQPNRPGIIIVAGLAVCWALAIRTVPTEVLTRGRHADAFFLAWSIASIGAVAVITALDPGSGSPAPFAFVLPLVFAALAYPPRLLARVAAIDAVACLGTLVFFSERDLASIAMLTGVLVAVGYMCATNARAHERLLGELARLTRTDPLTGCLNRRGFEEELADRAARHERYGTPFGLVLVDLDGFKGVNDRHGHAAGDALLRAAAAAAWDGVRTTDAVARIGGDEFAMVLDGADAELTAEIAARVRARVGEHIAASAGWASCPYDASDLEELYRRADERLYGAKGASASGRGRGTPDVTAPGSAAA